MLMLLALWTHCAFTATVGPVHVDPVLRRALITAAEKTTSFANHFAAQVWLLDMSTRLASELPNAKRRLTLLREIHSAAKRVGLDPQIVLAVIQVESHFKRFAISPAGARGLMQIMPFWVQAIGRPHDNLFDPSTNLRYGCTILAHYLKIEHGNLTRALARYNGSRGQYGYPVRVETALHEHWAVR